MADEQTTPVAAGGQGAAGDSWKPSFADDGVTFAPNWLEKAPEDWRDVAGSFEGVTSLKAAGERIKGLRQSLSEKGIAVPPDTATPEQKAAFLKELDKHRGVPEKPEDYGDLKPADRPDGVPWDDTLITEFSAMAPELGISKEAAAKLVAWFDKRSIGEIEGFHAQQAEAMKSEVAGLGKHYGERMDAAVELVRNSEVIKSSGWKPEKFDPKSPEFVGAEAFKLIHALATDAAAARGSDATRGNSASGGKEGLAWAKSVQDGSNKELAEIRKLPLGTPKRAELEERIRAAFASGLP